MLVSLAAAIALGAISVSDIALLAHLAPVLGEWKKAFFTCWQRLCVLSAPA